MPSPAGTLGKKSSSFKVAVHTVYARVSSWIPSLHLCDWQYLYYVYIYIKSSILITIILLTWCTNSYSIQSNKQCSVFQFILICMWNNPITSGQHQTKVRTSQYIVNSLRSINKNHIQRWCGSLVITFFRYWEGICGLSNIWRFVFLAYIILSETQTDSNCGQWIFFWNTHQCILIQ